MKKIIFAITLITLLCGCAPAYVGKMQSVRDDFLAGTSLLSKNDYAGGIQKITSAIDGVPQADSMYRADRNDNSHTKQTEDWWKKMKFFVMFGGRSVRSHGYLLLGKYDEAYVDANWVIDYYKKNRCTLEAFEAPQQECDANIETAVFVRAEYSADSARLLQQGSAKGTQFFAGVGNKYTSSIV